ncbi:hypothetical protein [Clostridium sp. SM-530-WT-3G]|uniref:hypothetical protein n=1 Tax=Clostridium sp. SM-530-WT-3G TaxID=2725303 RepID=UPI00145D6140|nr:hypothetical protein [Clostridium sp. SM-530-WT-3G]NME83338.1 hypothetical protein [Clostridium sp. SM-530-WT-3G]
MVEIILIMLVVIIMLLYLLFKFGIAKRRVIVTIVESLPIGIFKDNDKSYEIENRVYIKGTRKNELNLNNEDNNGNFVEGKDHLEESEYIDKTSDKTVYWTPKGRTYHISRSCFALSRSKIIVEGTVEESEKNTLCDLCKDYL